jgi:ATP-dependent RNA helicase DDX24/MAK5
LKSILKSKDKETQILQYDEDESEWAGFSDDEGQHGTGDVEKKNTKKDKIDEKTNKKKKNRETNVHKGDTEDTQLSLPFTVLQDELDEDEVDSSAWDSLGLSPAVQTGLSRLKYSSPTPIQKSCIPYILAGHDIIGKAPTGSGKTLAFGIPILEHFLNERNQGFLSGERGEIAPVALILSPTRELAHQLAKHVADLNAHTPDADAKIALLTGGLSIQKQQRLLKDANVVIGTPGRVWEILSSGSGLITKMKMIKYLVVDEADRLLSEGHFQEMEKILQSLDREENLGATDFGSEVTQGEAGKRRQTLVFSATFHRGLQQKLAGKGMAMNGDTLDNKQSMEYLLKKLKFREDRPKFVDVNPVSQMAEGLKEGVVECGAMEKVSFNSNFV